jgi:signal transduction histidine kinase
MLATLRYRLEPRLSAAGLALVWRVEDMPVLDWMDGQRTRHLQFLLFEAISNVLQHAQAKTLHIIAQADADVLEVDVLDDGKGFDAGSVTQRGLRTMRERATAIPASWDVQSNSAGTRVRFRIPRHPQA